MKKIISIVGARPQFIKAAVVSRELRKSYNEVMVHTGQHYDYNMSEIFFEELDIPRPEYNLGISGGSHGKMTGEMLIALEEVLLKENPDLVVLYGDTNSTLAGALAAVKLHIPVVHVESGNRFGTLESPEEVNRILTDHCSNLLLCCTESAKKFLELEGLGKQSFVVGDPMYDAFLFYSDKVGDKSPERLVGLDEKPIDDLPNNFYYLTCHRQENTDKLEHLTGILSAMEALGDKCIYPVHPRNQGKVIELINQHKYENIIFCNPVGYMMSIFMVKHCKKIVTDSGGLQREAFFAKKPCVTVLDFVVWPETMTGNCNQLCKPNKTDILLKLDSEVEFPSEQPFGDGHSAKLIVNKINELIK